MPGPFSDPKPPRSPLEVRIADAKALSDPGAICREALEHLAAKRGATAVVAFRGTARDASEIATATAWAVDDKREIALDTWFSAFLAYVDTNVEAFEPFGAGVTVVIAVEADGTVRCVTHSDTKADCARMVGWADKWLFKDLSKCPWETHLGAGLGGIPRGLTAKERAQIARLPQGFVEAWLDTAPEIAA